MHFWHRTSIKQEYRVPPRGLPQRQSEGRTMELKHPGLYASQGELPRSLPPRNRRRPVFSIAGRAFSKLPDAPAR